MNIAIIFPNLRGFYSRAEFWDSTSVAEIDIDEINRLSAILVDDGHEVDYYELFYKNKNEKDINKIVKSKRYDLVFIYTEYDSLINSVKIAKTFKENNQKTLVAPFGYYTIYNYKKIMQISPYFDVSIVSLDEYTFKEFVDCVQTNKEWKEVQGVAYRGEKGIVSLTPPRSLYYDFKTPWAKRDGREIISAEIRTISGCTSQCIFCEVANARRNLKFFDIKMRDVQDVVDEIEYLCKNRATKYIKFADESFLLHSDKRSKWLDDFIELCKIKEIKVKFTINSRVVDVINYKHLLPELLEIGFENILIGVESLLDSKLKFFRKGVIAEKNIEAYKLLDELGFNLGVGFLLFDPYVSLKEIKENLSLIKTHGMYKHVLGSASTFPFPIDSVVAVVASSDLYNMVEKDGLVTRDNWYGYDFKYPEVEQYRNVLVEWNDVCPSIDTELFKTVTSESSINMNHLSSKEYCDAANRLKLINLEQSIALCDLVLEPSFDSQSFIAQWQEQKSEIYKIIEKYMED